MPETFALSESAVAVLRFRVKGYRVKVTDHSQEAFRELAAAGIIEPVPGADGNLEPDYRFTEVGWARRQELLSDAEGRIERERFEPPDASNLSESARVVVRRILSGERVEVTSETRDAFRELAAARIIILMHSFAKGDESTYQFTYWGWKRRLEWIEDGCVKQPTVPYTLSASRSQSPSPGR
jgi:hypothetical protein